MKRRKQQPEPIRLVRWSNNKSISATNTTTNGDTFTTETSSHQHNNNDNKTHTINNCIDLASNYNNNNNENINKSIYPKIYSHENKKSISATTTQRKISPSLTTTKRKSSSSIFNSSSASTRKKENNNNILLIEKYKPTQSKELCISSRKVKEVREWIENSYIDGNRRKLLILLGDPGIGKSTMCTIIAKELNISIIKWNNDESILLDNSNINILATAAHNNNKSSSIKSFEEFLSSSVNGYSKLDIDYDTANNSSSSSNSVLDKENYDIKSNKRSLILIDDLPYIHRAHAQEAFRNMFTNHIQNTKIPIIIIYSNVSEGKPAFGQIEKIIDTSTLTNNLRMIKCTSISDKIIKKVLLSILQKEERSANNNNNRIYNSNHNNNKKKNMINNEFLNEICLSSHGDIRNAINALQIHITTMKQKRKLSFISSSSPSSTSSRNKKNLSSSTSSSNNNNDESIYKRDCKLNSFHALGKLLYAKRINRDENINNNGSPSFQTLEKLLYNNNTNTNKSSSLLQYDNTTTTTLTPTPIQQESTIASSRPPLSFNPENVIQQNDMSDVHTSLCFLSYNSPDFFSDIIDLSNAFTSFSDAALFSSRCFHSQRDHGDTIFPNEYLSSIASRTVAQYNKQPSPNKFRSYKKHPIFNVNKKQKGNVIKIRQLCRRLSIGSTQHLPLSCSIASCNDVVLDYMPFMRTIIPCETQFAVENLYSYVKAEDSNIDGNKNEISLLPQDEIENLLHLELQEQNQILQEDDIVED